MYYFKFEIPEGITYSPDWFGDMPHTPSNVAVLLYNDKEHYGIAKTEDTFVPKEVVVIDEVKALSLVDEAKEDVGTYKGLTLYDKWKPEPIKGVKLG